MTSKMYTVVPTIGDAETAFVRQPDGTFMYENGSPEFMSIETARKFVAACNSCVIEQAHKEAKLENYSREFNAACDRIWALDAQIRSSLDAQIEAGR